MTDYDQRSYIKYRTLLGATAQSIIDDLVKIHGNEAYKKTTVYKWMHLFKHGRDTVEDDPRSGRPVTATTPANIQLVQYLIQENQQVSYAELEDLTNLSRGGLQHIIHEHLKLKKRATGWRPLKQNPNTKHF